ncbi:MAG TPA: hypothetical protein VGR35_05870 [Tepidisphaeraceae bacterium]|nr:hypothetical protein [Tepidisphaeraceae bacterium]
MHEIACTSSAVQLPAPRVPIAIRTATMCDLPFLDAMQKKHSKALGFFPRAQMQGYVENGWVLIAEERHEGTEARRHEGGEEAKRGEVNSLDPSTPFSSLRASVPSCLRASHLGYIISRDRYLKRDELRVIYQLCVAPNVQRKLVGASLLKAVFERSAYGCRLFCCWCAQDLEANYFWESIGFVPIAFRGGSGKKKRVHIFWQRRIREGDVSTPWWFPAKTDQGAMREDRLVLPIPPGLHWSDEMPVLSAVEGPVMAASGSGETPKPRRAKATVVPMEAPVRHGPRQYGGPPPVLAVAQKIAEKMAEKIKPPKKQKAKVDPKRVAAARELRDRYLEHVNGQRVNGGGFVLEGAGKYDVGRMPRLGVAGADAVGVGPTPMLPAA